jgi:hypothetical protein
MTTLVSAGVSVTVTDESFFIPAAAKTVPLFFVATQEGKKQPDGVSDAVGTLEANRIRLVTSKAQSLQLYGVPVFNEDGGGNPYHGDSTNEYGLFALNQYMTIGNLAYVVRADVNLATNITDIRALWSRYTSDASAILSNTVQQVIDDYNTTNNLAPGDVGFKVTVTDTELLAAIEAIIVSELISSPTFEQVAAVTGTDITASNFFDDSTITPINIFENGYDAAASGTFIGITGLVADWVLNTSGGTVNTEFTPTESATLFDGAAGDYQYSIEFRDETSIGANDAARRVPITAALTSAMDTGLYPELISEITEYNLVACPGYYETVDNMVSLSQAIKEEAFVVGDTPFDADFQSIVDNFAPTKTTNTATSALYYPHGLGANVDGKDVFCAASGTALRVIAQSDNASEVWFAPAGVRRGKVADLVDTGIVSGDLGGPTEFVPVHLNQGQRDVLYNYPININPITFFPGRGIIMWGQKTQQPEASARDRINVERMIMFIRRQLRKNLIVYVFQPNDEITRNSVKAFVEGFLGDILIKRGLYDFAVICDESNNTPTRIDRNELYVDVAIKPVKAAEFVYVPIRVLNTGADLPS